MWQILSCRSCFRLISDDKRIIRHLVEFPHCTLTVLGGPPTDVIKWHSNTKLNLFVRNGGGYDLKMCYCATRWLCVGWHEMAREKLLVGAKGINRREINYFWKAGHCAKPWLWSTFLWSVAVGFSPLNFVSSRHSYYVGNPRELHAIYNNRNKHDGHMWWGVPK